MKLRVLLLALCVGACGQIGEKTEAPADEAPDPFTLNIEIGRYGVMLDQVSELTRARPGAAEAEVTDPRDLARRLRETVWEYNVERSRLCAKGLYTEVSCGPPYQPIWISEPETATPSIEDLQIRSAAVGAEVMRLWEAVCGDARSETGDEQRSTVCAME